MSINTPSQTRTVDPFASYNSSIVNHLTRMITRGENALTNYNDLQVTLDTTSPTTAVVVSTGSVYKDDMFITIDQDHRVDFENSNNYYSFGAGFNEIGYYHICLEYTYAKSRPAPEAKIKIIKPSQVSTAYNSSAFFFLKAIQVQFISSTFQITSLEDYDPDNTTHARNYVKSYFGVVTNSTFDEIADFNSDTDRGRTIYESESGKFYFGLTARWVSLDELGGSATISSVNTDTTGLWVGALVYSDYNKNAQLAVATHDAMMADMVVNTIGTVALATASCKIVGEISGVKVETGAIVSKGDVLYLSDIEPGKVTNIKPNFIQNVGRALSNGDVNTDITMLFIPRGLSLSALKGEITTWDGTNGDYYYDIDISDLDTTGNAVVTSFFAENDGVLEMLQPAKTQLVDAYKTLRVWMNTNLLSIKYTVSTGIGGSSTAISGGSLPSIPAGEIILFESDTAVTGYTLLTDYNDGVVYITAGSGVHEEAGGTNKTGGTWTHPNHAHTIAMDGSSHVHVISGDGSHAHKWKEGSTETTFDSEGAALTLTGGVSADGITITATGGTIQNDDFWTEAVAGHDHTGETGPGDDAHNHGGTTGSSATINTWRPKGRNFTRQMKNS